MTKTMELLAKLRCVPKSAWLKINKDERYLIGEVTHEAATAIEQLDADAAGVQAELASIKRTREQERDYADVCYENQRLKGEILELRQQRHALQNDLTAARLALGQLANGFKYSAEVCGIAREALGPAAEPSEGYNQAYADQMRTALLEIVSLRGVCDRGSLSIAQCFVEAEKLASKALLPPLKSPVGLSEEQKG